MRLWKEVLNITWSDKVCNEDELRRDGEERAIISVINRRQRVWLGYTLRHGDHVPLITEGRIPGKRPPGRPRGEMLDRVKGGNSYVGSRGGRKDLPVGRSSSLLKSGNKRAFTSHFVFETEMMRYKAKRSNVV